MQINTVHGKHSNGYNVWIHMIHTHLYLKKNISLAVLGFVLSMKTMKKNLADSDQAMLIKHEMHIQICNANKKCKCK